MSARCAACGAALGFTTPCVFSSVPAATAAPPAVAEQCLLRPAVMLLLLLPLLLLAPAASPTWHTPAAPVPTSSRRARPATTRRSPCGAPCAPAGSTRRARGSRSPCSAARLGRRPADPCARSASTATPGTFAPGRNGDFFVREGGGGSFPMTVLLLLLLLFSVSIAVAVGFQGVCMGLYFHSWLQLTEKKKKKKKKKKNIDPADLSTVRACWRRLRPCAEPQSRPGMLTCR
jgi:hypothetical protein